MRRLGHVILAVVVAFVLVVAATLYTRTRAREVEPVGPTPIKADLNVKEVRVEEETGKVRWRLTAERALMWDEKGAGRTELRRVNVEVDEPDRSWSIVGDEGEYLQKEKRIELRGNVVVTSTDGLRLETNTLRWQAKERRVWTNDPVTIFRDGAVIQGQGLEAWMADERTQVKGRLRVTFAERAQERAR